jgi:predicted nucleotidyltransferase
MTASDLKIALELKKRISEVTRLIDFKVFGSRARGDDDKYSDLDVFIVTESTDRAVEDKIQHIAWEVGLNYSVFISPLIFSRYEIEESPLRASPIVKNILEEGLRV